MWSGIPGRIILVLQDFLTAELATITTEEGDAISLPPVQTEDYHEWLIPVITAFPSVRIQQQEATPVETRAANFGQRVAADYRHNIYVDAGLINADTPTVLLKMTQRYAAGIFRVLCLFKNRLETTADPTGWAESVTPAGAITVGPEVDNEQGLIVRTAIVPVNVRRRESRL
jgi:hypothetical protein